MVARSASPKQGRDNREPLADGQEGAATAAQADLVGTAALAHPVDAQDPENAEDPADTVVPVDRAGLAGAAVREGAAVQADAAVPADAALPTVTTTLPDSGSQTADADVTNGPRTEAASPKILIAGTIGTTSPHNDNERASSVDVPLFPHPR